MHYHHDEEQQLSFYKKLHIKTYRLSKKKDILEILSFYFLCRTKIYYKMLAVNFETTHKPAKPPTNHPQTTDKPPRHQSNHPQITHKPATNQPKIAFHEDNSYEPQLFPCPSCTKREMGAFFDVPARFRISPSPLYNSLPSLIADYNPSHKLLTQLRTLTNFFRRLRLKILQ